MLAVIEGPENEASDFIYDFSCVHVYQSGKTFGQQKSGWAKT